MSPMRYPDGERHGSSTWQSLERRAGTTEVDYLNGEVVLLGRLHGVPTPVNAVLQRVAARMAREGMAPGSFRESDLLAVALRGVQRVVAGVAVGVAALAGPDLRFLALRGAYTACSVLENA